MATQGWHGYGYDGGSPSQVPRRKGRRSIAELLVAKIESDLEGPLRDWAQELLRELKDHGLIRCWFHVPDTRRTRPEERGFPDLAIGVRPGLVLHVELKRLDGKGKLGAEQATWLLCAADRGAVCSSQDEFLEFLRKWGVVK